MTHALPLLLALSNSNGWDLVGIADKAGKY